MPIDPNIALGVKPIQLESPVNQMAKMYEMQNAQQSNQLNQMKMDEYQRGIATSQRRNALLGGFTPDMSVDDRVNKLVQGGFLDEAKSLAESASKVNMDKRLGRAAELDALSKAHNIYKTTVGGIIGTPTQANAISQIRRAGKLLNEDTSDDEAEVMALGENPDAIRQWAANLALEAEKLLPKSDKLDLGGSVQDRSISPITGMPTVVGTTKKTQTPDSIASQNIQRANQAETARHNVVMEGQGKIPAGYRLLPDGSLETIPGGPADAKTKIAEAGQSTVDSLAATLNGYYDKLSQGGGIVSSNKRIGTNVGSAIQSSGVGQFLGGAVGTENQTTRQNILNARPLLLQAIMKATGMSAKQMDSNQELKLYLSAATDPSKSLESNKEALANLVRLYGIGGEATPGGAKTKPIMPRNEKMPSSNPHAGKTDAQIKKELGIN
jgi:hypothetical protein